MKLSFPVTSEILTLNFSTFRTFESELRNQHDLSVLQYRAMSLMQQRGEIAESRMIDELGTTASQVSQNLGKLASRGIASWAPTAGPAKTWSLTGLGMRVLDDADIIIIQVYDRYFSSLNASLEQLVRPGLRMTCLSRGIIRVKDDGFFDEQAYFETILSVVHATTESLHAFRLSPAQFRILFELAEKGPTVKAHLAKRLLLTRSTINWVCESLSDRGFLLVAADASSRTKPVALTESGRIVAQRAAESVNRAWCDMRVWAPEEKPYYQQAAEYFVRLFAG